MYVSIIPVLVFVVATIFPVMAGSVGQETLNQGKTKNEPKPANTGDQIQIQEYLFIGQDNLMFDTTSPLDSGLLPASGPDEEDPLKSGKKPVLPSYD